MKKVILLGLGRWGKNHLRVLHSLPIEFYVAEVSAKQLEQAAKLGIPSERLATDYRKFLPVVDAAVIVTPAQTHFPICREFLDAGKDVFVEKPITLTSADAIQLADLATKRQRILQVGHIFRFDTASAWLKEHLNEFGPLHMLRGVFSGFKRPRNDSGVSFADSIHFIDLFNYLMKGTPTRVTAHLNDFLGRGMEDVSLISMDYERNGKKVWATVESGYFSPGKLREVTIVGGKLSAVCDFNAAQYKIKVFENQHTVKGAEYEAVEGVVRRVECTPEEPLLAELRAFIHSVETRTPPLADGHAGVESVRVLEAAMESAKSGKTVSLER